MLLCLSGNKPDMPYKPDNLRLIALLYRAGKNTRSQYPNGISARRTAIPARYDSFSAAPTYISGMTGYTKLALQYRSGTVRSSVKKNSNA